MQLTTISCKKMGKLEDDIKTFTHEKRHPIINEKRHYSKTNPFGLFSFFRSFFRTIIFVRLWFKKFTFCRSLTESYVNLKKTFPFLNERWPSLFCILCIDIYKYHCTTECRFLPIRVLEISDRDKYDEKVGNSMNASLRSTFKQFQPSIVESLGTMIKGVHLVQRY